MAPKTTSCWILCSDPIYPPGSSICLGNVLEDPFIPHEPLCRLPAEQWPELTTSSEGNVAKTHGTAHGANVSIGAELLAIVNANAHVDVGTSGDTEYVMSALRAEFFKEYPAEGVLRALFTPLPPPNHGDGPSQPQHQQQKQQEVHERAHDALFSARSWFWPHRLFIITGLRIAVGLHRSSGREASRTGGVSAAPADALLAAAGAVGSSVSVEVGGHAQNTYSYSATAEGEVVLAYRLASISPRGWRGRKALRLSEYRLSDTARTLGGAREDAGGERAANIEVTEATETDVVPFIEDGEDKEIEAMKTRIVTLEE